MYLYAERLRNNFVNNLTVQWSSLESSYNEIIVEKLPDKCSIISCGWLVYFTP